MSKLYIVHCTLYINYMAHSYLHINQNASLQGEFINRLSEEYSWAKRETIFDGKLVTVKEIREYFKSTSKRPLDDNDMHLVITGAENISQEVANTMLKILEEPPGYLYIHLITANEEQVIATIVSRCHRVRYNHQNVSSISGDITAPTTDSDSDLPNWDAMSQRQKLCWSDELSKSDDISQKLMAWALSEKQKGNIDFAYKIEKLATKMASSNINKRLCLDNFILSDI